MPNPIPPPGPERDAEIMKGLGWQPTIIGRGYFLHGVEDITHWKRPDGSQTGIVPPYSTDPAAADRLVEEMVRRGFALDHTVTPYAAGVASMAIIHRARFTERGQAAFSPWSESGIDRVDAISRAALVALRGGA